MAAFATLWPRIRFWLILLVCLYAAIVFLAWLLQRKLIYFPDASEVTRPGGLAWRGLKELSLTTSDGVSLQAWYLPGEKPGTVLFFHGNAGNRGDRAFHLQGIHDLGYGVLLPDYRGYGGSGGTPSERGFYRDAVCCRNWLRKNVEGPVAYLGNSVGSGVACELARRDRPAGLILLSAFSSLVDVGRNAYPILPLDWILEDRFENVAKMSAISCPLLMVHGDADRLVPIALARRVHDAAQPPVTWIEVEGAGHNDLLYVAGERYWDELRAFLDRTLRP